MKMAPVKITVKSDLPEFGNMHPILNCQVEPDITWDDFLKLNAVKGFDKSKHVITSRKHNKVQVAKGEDKIEQTSKQFERDVFQVKIASSSSPLRDSFATIGKRTVQQKPRMPLEAAKASPKVTRKSRGSVSASVGAAVNGPIRPISTPAIGKIAPTTSVKNIKSANPQPGPSSQISVAIPMNASRGRFKGRGRGMGSRGRGGRASASITIPILPERGPPVINLPPLIGGPVAGDDKPPTLSSSKEVSGPKPRPPKRRKRAGDANLILNGSAPTASSSKSAPKPKQVKISRSDLHTPAVERQARRDDFMSIVCGDPVAPQNNEVEMPNEGSVHKDKFLQYARRVPSADFKGFYEELQSLRQDKDELWRWTRKTPRISTFLNFVFELA